MLPHIILLLFFVSSCHAYVSVEIDSPSVTWKESIVEHFDYTHLCISEFFKIFTKYEANYFCELDCSEYPYNFVDGYRSVFFLLEWKLPGVMDFIKTTHCRPVMFLREFFNESMMFDESVIILDDNFVGCFWITFPDFIYFLLFLFLSFYFFVPVAWVCFLILICITGIIILLPLEAGSLIMKKYKNRSK